ncbi:MAG: MarR family transcriptional regulator [Clostridium sp.]|uniref:MarR family winged helix-turn-helix transcriptional regulator n=1 Tax=Clostridium sp. TaxID=1506 RepID=UPI003056C01E
MKRYETESISRYISHFHRIGSNFLSKKYEKADIGFAQYKFLIQLYLTDGLSHDELTEKVSVDKGTTTRAIKKLWENGYVRIELNENDKRKYHIYLTEKAIYKREEILSISALWEDKLTGCLSPNELDTLLELLRKIGRNNSGYFFSENEK